MEKAGLPPPVFESGRGVFKVTLYNEKTTKSNGKDGFLSERLLAFCEVPRTRAELEQFTGFSRYYTMSKIVQPLVDAGQIRLTLPDKPKSAKQMYVKA